MRSWLVALIAVCVGVPIAVGVHVLDRDRDAAVQAFARDKLADLSEAAQDLGGNLARVGDDLAFAALIPEHASTPDSAARELGAIASVKRAYLVLVVQSPAGARLHVAAPGAPEALAAPMIDRMLDAAERAPGELQISPGLSTANDEAAWFRVFARKTPSGGAAAAVVDMRQVVIPPRLLRVGAARLLVLSAHGVPAPISDSAMTDLSDPAIARLIARAVAREPSAVSLAATSAAALGLPAANAIAAAVPVPIDRGAPWVLALVASTDSLDARHAALAWRMAMGGVLGLALLAFATSYVVRATRREAVLRERLRAEASLLRSEKLATAGQLSAGIAHEISTPLGIVRGRAELAIGRLGPAHAETAGLRVIVDQIDHVMRLIEQLLAYARPDARTAQRVEACAALDGVVELLAAKAASQRVALERSDASGAVIADPGQLGQVLVNIAMNAIDACADGGRVTLAARPAGGAVAIEIADTGHGISPEDRAHLFDPFFTRKKRGKGTGLGLWVVAEICRAYAAEIEVESIVGRGTVVRLLWPNEGRA